MGKLAFHPSLCCYFVHCWLHVCMLSIVAAILSELSHHIPRIKFWTRRTLRIKIGRIRRNHDLATHWFGALAMPLAFAGCPTTIIIACRQQVSIMLYVSIHFLPRYKHAMHNTLNGGTISLPWHP